jgi:energy-coupling factor transport system ATP-binding protein
VTGPNGAGKTTLALALCGLLDLDSGTAAHRGRAGYVAQDPAAYLLHDTVLDEVEYGLGNLGVPAPARRARAEAELDRFDLGWAAAEHPRDLSSGERQRLAVASVTAMRPDLVVLDEPTRGVDGRRKQALTALVRGLAADGAGVVVVSHDAPFVADVATAAVVMAGGRVAAAARPGSEAVHA